jgi:antitoxin YefM
VKKAEREMARQTTYTEARANFARLWDQVVEDRDTVIITRRGAKDVALIAADELAGLQETAHLLRSPENARRLLTALNRALQRTEAPRTIADLRQDLGLAPEA